MKRTKVPRITGVEKVQELLIRIRTKQLRGKLRGAKALEKQLAELQEKLKKKLI